MESGVWRLSAGLSLIRPDGRTVDLPYRKVAELLSLLAAGAEDREELARSLWPDALRADRLTNLRQCIARLRAALPDGAIDTDRLRCRLSARFKIESEAPGQVKPGGASQLESLVLWYARHDPARMMEVLRVNPESALAMDKSALRSALKIAALEPGLTRRDVAWGHLFRGVAQLSASMEESAGHLSLALTEAEVLDDLCLLELAIYWQGVTLILRGRLLEADRRIRRSRDLYETRARQPSRRIENLSAHVLLHQGNTEEALRRLEYIEGMESNSMTDRLSDQTLRALYLSFEGRTSEAAKLLDAFHRVGIPAGASRSSLYASLAEAYLEAEQSGVARLGKLESQVSEFAAVGERHMEIYTREGLGVLLARKGRVSDARREIAVSRGIRAQIDLGYTAWDRGRLKDAAFRDLLPCA